MGKKKPPMRLAPGGNKRIKSSIGYKCTHCELALYPKDDKNVVSHKII